MMIFDSVNYTKLQILLVFEVYTLISNLTKAATNIQPY